MNIREQVKQFVMSITREILAMWFAFLDRRVRWYVKLVLLGSVLYVLLPYDLISDNRRFWGQVDDLVVLRVGYLLGRKLIDPAILDGCRTRASVYLEARVHNRLYVVASLIMVWGAALLLLGRYLARKFGK